MVEAVTKKDNGSEPAVASETKKETPAVVWDDSQMASSYANVVNVTSSREEVTLFFGTNQTWNATDAEKVIVNLSNRIIVNPHAAKRLLTLLMAIVSEYEKRFGKIDIGPRPDMPPEK